MLEKTIERKFKRFLPKWSKYVKYVDPGQCGGPDRLILLPKGITAFIEWKRPGEKPRVEQIAYMNDLKKLGHHTNWFDNVEEALEWLNSLITNNEQ